MPPFAVLAEVKYVVPEAVFKTERGVIPERTPGLVRAAAWIENWTYTCRIWREEHVDHVNQLK